MSLQKAGRRISESLTQKKGALVQARAISFLYAGLSSKDVPCHAVLGKVLPLAGSSPGFTRDASRKLSCSFASSYLNFWSCLIEPVNAISHHNLKS